MNSSKRKIQKDSIKKIISLDDAKPSIKYGWKSIAAIASMIIALIFGYSMWNSSGNNSNLKYETEDAIRGDLIIKVTATGTVEPTNTVDVSSELSGTLLKVNVDYNSIVKAGDILAELDAEKVNANVESAKAKLAAARAKVKTADITASEMKLVYERKKKLQKRKISTQHDLDAAKANYDRAIAAIDSSKADVLTAVAELKLQKTDLSKTKIYSPINGIILARAAETGQTVASSLTAPVLFTIAEDLTQMEVQVDVDEADVGKIKSGQKATFTVDAYPDEIFEAQIRELYFGSEIVQSVVTYKAILTTGNPDLLLRPGMTATAEIIIKELKGIISVPNAALRFAPATENETADNRSILDKLLPGPPIRRKSSVKTATGSNRTVWVLENGQPIKIPVEIGSTDGNYTQILKGAIKADQAIIIDSKKSK